MISKIYAAIPHGFGGEIIEVEGDMNRGLPAFNIVGMANKTVNEARERVRSAIANSKFSFPDKKVTISLAPADLVKDGAYLDLPIALSVMVMSKQLLPSDVRGKLFVGELALDGKLRPVKGIINIVEAAKEAGFKEVYLPVQNLAQAALITGVTAYGVDTLQNLFLQLKRQEELLQASIGVKRPVRPHDPAPDAILDHIRGQATAKRAMAVAIAGHHNILISGPPGAGKTLLAKAAANLLPELTPEEMIAITKLHSLSGVATGEIVTQRPFRSPHHTASTTSVIGGRGDGGPRGNFASARGSTVSRRAAGVSAVGIRGLEAAPRR